MKKLLLGVLLPIFSLFAIIGTGFATWYFNDTTVEAKGNDLSLEVEDYAHVGTISITPTEALKLHFDQPSDKINGVDGISLQNGTTKDPQNITGTYKGPAGSFSRAVIFKVTVTLPETVAQYVELKGFTKETNTFTKEVEVQENVDGTSVSQDLTVNSADFQYIKGKVPQNVKDYDTMKAALTGTINVKFEATIK